MENQMTFQERIKWLLPVVLGIMFSAVSVFVGKLIDPSITVSGLEFASVFTSYVCVILCVTQKRSNYFWGIASTFLYCILFWQSKLIALAVFNGVLVMSLIYGYFRWGPDGKGIPVTNVAWSSYPQYGIFGLVVLFAMIMIFRSLGEPINNVDIITAVLSAVAQLMLDNKKRQTWILWAIVNLFSLYLFYTSGLILVFIQYVLFLANTVYGWVLWSRTMEKA
jgi:nicotinamide mononucleotide transporter